MIALAQSAFHSPSIDSLLKKIRARLAIQKFCIIFEKDLERVWPAENKARIKREAAILAFAAAHSLSARINDPGLRVTFRNLEPK
jgi:hypothetical protein